MTVAVFGPWQPCGRERGGYRSAPRHRRAAFPPRPPREQSHRQRRPQHDALGAFLLQLVQGLGAPPSPSDALGSAGVPPRDAPRRGAGGLPGLAAMGWSHRGGGYAGVPLRLAVPPVGARTGLGVGAASPNAQPLAEPGFAWRRQPHPGRRRVGAPALGPSGVEKGCAGQAKHAAWGPTSGGHVLCPPKRNRKTPWPQGLRRWRAGVWQIVETVYAKRWQTCRLDRERPHDLSGVRARLAAKLARHNCCIWLHEQLGRPLLAFTDLVAW
jgi:hypothetical protein